MKTKYELQVMHDLRMYQPDLELDPLFAAKYGSVNVWLRTPTAKLLFKAKNHVLYIVRKKYYKTWDL